MPVTEQLVGITETLGSHHAFRAILKQTVNDFIVNEVMLDGEVAHINHTPILPPKRPRSETHNASSSRHESGHRQQQTGAPNPTDKQYETLDALFEAQGPENSASASVRTMLQSSADDTPAIFPVCTDKTKRTLMHAWVRQHLPGYLSETIDAAKAPAIQVRLERSVPPNKRYRSNRHHHNARSAPPPSPPSDGAPLFSGPQHKAQVPEHPKPSSRIPHGSAVQFVLWKRSRDTNDAIISLSKVMYIPPASFSYAGTKDKRAVTTQLVQVPYVSESVFAHANRKLLGPPGRHPCLLIGNVKAAKKSRLHLGDLLGNRFTLALRDVLLANDADEANIRSAVKSLQTLGFVNYFGLQRFGSGISPTHETGFALIRNDYKDVCRRLLLPVRVGEARNSQEVDNVRPERRQMVDALDEFLAGKISAKEMVSQLPKRMHVERTIGRALAEQEDKGATAETYDYYTAFQWLPRNLRNMYGHAVQSFLFNVMASKRIRNYPPNDSSRLHAIAGDLVLEDESGASEMNYETRVRPVTKEEEEQKEISIFRVVIPMIGSAVSLPDNEWGKEAAKVLAEQNVDMLEGMSSQYGLKGTYRKLLAKPENVEMKIVCYTNKDENLTGTGIEDLDFDQLRGKRKDSHGGGLRGPQSENVDVAKSTAASERAKAAEIPETESVDKMGQAEDVVSKDRIDAEVDEPATATQDDKDNKAVDTQSKEGSVENGTKVDLIKPDPVVLPEKFVKGNPSDLKDVAIKESDLAKSEVVEGSGPKNDDGNTMATKTATAEAIKAGPTEEGASEASEGGQNFVKEKLEVSDGGAGGGASQVGEKKRTALVLSFTLGCAEYATMLVRELTKQDSSTANQKRLQEGIEPPTS